MKILKNACLIIHIVPSYGYKFLNMGIHRKYMSYYSHSSFFIVTHLWNMGIQGNENSFFTCYLKVVLHQFFWNLEFISDDSISHYCWSLFLIKLQNNFNKSRKYSNFLQKGFFIEYLRWNLSIFSSKRYINANLKMSLYVRVHIKIIARKFSILKP